METKGEKMRRDAYGDGDLSELSDFFHTFFSRLLLSLNKFPLSSLPPREEENYLYHFLRKEMA